MLCLPREVLKCTVTSYLSVCDAVNVHRRVSHLARRVWGNVVLRRHQLLRMSREVFHVLVGVDVDRSCLHLLIDRGDFHTFFPLIINYKIEHVTVKNILPNSDLTRFLHSDMSSLKSLTVPCNTCDLDKIIRRQKLLKTLTLSGFVDAVVVNSFEEMSLLCRERNSFKDLKVILLVDARSEYLTSTISSHVDRLECWYFHLTCMPVFTQPIHELTVKLFFVSQLHDVRREIARIFPRIGRLTLQYPDWT
jgi:hypothetical protein